MLRDRHKARRSRVVCLLIIASLAQHAIAQPAINYESVSRTVLTKVVGVPDGAYANGNFGTAKFWQPQGGTLIKGSNVMVMMDTGNQVIRKVDWGLQTVSHIAGNVTVLGNCLDQSCPANSFRDGIAGAATFTMPYSVQMHHQNRHAFVADTRSNAIRKVNLYTSNVLTIIRDVGYPTDIVSWDNKIAFCEGQGHSIWIYSAIDTPMLNQVSGAVWNTNNLALLSGANNPASGLYAEGSGGVGGKFVLKPQRG